MQLECARYVALSGGAEKGGDGDNDGKRPLTGTQLAELYLSLRQGLSVKSWCMEHADAAARMDVRRFVTFGVIKGFLYRVHRYAVGASVHRSGSSKRLTRANFSRSRLRDEGQRKKREKEDREGEKAVGEAGSEDLGAYLDGTHCFDEICTDLMISEKELTARLKAWGDVQIICR